MVGRVGFGLPFSALAHVLNGGWRPILGQRRISTSRTQAFQTAAMKQSMSAAGTK